MRIRLVPLQHVNVSWLLRGIVGGHAFNEFSGVSVALKQLSSSCCFSLAFFTDCFSTFNLIFMPQKSLIICMYFLFCSHIILVVFVSLPIFH